MNQNRRNFLKFGIFGIFGALAVPSIISKNTGGDIALAPYKGYVYTERGYFYAPYIPIYRVTVMDGSGINNY